MSEFEGQEKLEELRKKDPSSLTEADRAFLTARRSYLHAHELAAFGIEADAAPADESEQEEDEESDPVKPVKKSKAKAKDESEQEPA